MKKIFKISLMALFTLGVITSCKKEAPVNADLSALDRKTVTATALDNWLNTNFLTPYNIEIKYRWDPYEVDFDKTLVPPKESQVQPAMETVRDIWIKPYEKVGGADFMKINTPKQFYLVGSPSYNGDGTITLGTAEGGKKIVLFIINDFTKSNTAAVTEMIHVIEHEFTHILNQKIPYNPLFNTVTKADYTANWNIFTAADAKALGFISQYSRSNPLDDFAEMTSLMLTMGNSGYNAYVAGMTTAAAAKIRLKEQYVVDYFKTAYNIDFYALQREVTAAIDANAPALSTVLGTGKTYTTFTSNPLTPTPTPQSTEYTNLYNTAKAGLTASGLTLGQYTLTFGPNNIVTQRFAFLQGTTAFNADIEYGYSIDASGVITFTTIAQSSTAGTFANYNSLRSAFSGLNTYMIANKFKVDYATNVAPGTKGLPGALGAFYKITDTNSYMIGTLN